MPRPDSRRLLRTDAGYDPSHRHPDDPDYSPEQGLCSYKFQYYDTCAGQHGLDSCNEADLHAVHAALDLNLDAVLANEANWVTVVEQTEYSESLLHEDFSAVNARYVRLVIDQTPNGAGGPGIAFSGGGRGTGGTGRSHWYLPAFTSLLF